MTDEEFLAEYMEDTDSMFRDLFADANALEHWLDFMALPSEQQAAMLQDRHTLTLRSRKDVALQRAAHGLQLTPHQAFLRIDRNIRAMLKKQAIPLV